MKDVIPFLKLGSFSVVTSKIIQRWAGLLVEIGAKKNAYTGGKARRKEATAKTKT
jgi:hypothetical protein